MSVYEREPIRQGIAEVLGLLPDEGLVWHVELALHAVILSKDELTETQLAELFIAALKEEP